MDIKKLARKNVLDLNPYPSARKLGGKGEIWLNANESPFKNEYTYTDEGLNRYGECQPPSLILSYAQYAHLPPENVLTSRGADESIDLLIRTFCEPGKDAILYCPPTYGMYAISAEIAGVQRKTVPLTAQWQLDLTSIKKNLKDVKLVFVCHPNNPTGNLMHQEDLIALLNMTQGKALLVLDEAYIDFCEKDTGVPLLDKYPHLVILRTLSKAFALAGLRCGFTLAHPKIIQLMLKIIAPYPVSIPVTHIACQALSKKGIARMKKQVDTLNLNRAFFQTELSKLPGATLFDSQANFMLFQCQDTEAVFSTLWENGIILRRTPIKGFVRLSVGLLEDAKKIVELIQKKHLF